MSKRESIHSAPQDLFSIHDPPVDKSKKTIPLRRSTMPGKLGPSSNKKKSLFAQETTGRTFFIPEQLPNQPSVPSYSHDVNRDKSLGSPINKPLKMVNKSSTPIQQSAKRITSNNKTAKTRTVSGDDFLSSKVAPVPSIPLHTKTSAIASTYGVQKKTINLRTRPKSASAARYQNSEPAWSIDSTCPDRNVLTIERDTQRWSKIPVENVLESDTQPRTKQKALSSRKPALPGQVCYGTNNKGVSLPRRPQSAKLGRENRPSAIVNKEGKEYHREEFGGWEASTQLTDERTGYDTRYRYPQKLAAADMAAVHEYKSQPTPSTNKPAWVHTTSSSNFAKSPV